MSRRLTLGGNLTLEPCPGKPHSELLQPRLAICVSASPREPDGGESPDLPLPTETHTHLRLATKSASSPLPARAGDRTLVRRLDLSDALTH
ncbi:hypothetical protein CGGC5_v013772 [Colletotrichum fructicola Nara gc5]|uniref:Uncharacterized protein n=1 Tax=Colletotrichum fructicola (strain Nara gc5) TaxID=1213859 RepID=A0A7J6IN08_COLFN|nr:hypothetical protein CFRS1_v008609 [Colletotrichum fructicola]KAF4478128.1 hypothetical protein CGGC5_v013772 [Colletotrichum fructicola Nara gc5]